MANATRCLSICGRAILSRSDFHVDVGRLAELLPLPRDEEGSVSTQLQEAQAFALAAASARGEPDDGSRYYHHWAATLERLVTEMGLSNVPELTGRKTAWADAYRHTPHGKPVLLSPPE